MFSWNYEGYVRGWNRDEHHEYPLKETKTYFWVNLEVYREILNNMDSIQYYTYMFPPEFLGNP